MWDRLNKKDLTFFISDIVVADSILSNTVEKMPRLRVPQCYLFALPRWSIKKGFKSLEQWEKSLFFYLFSSAKLAFFDAIKIYLVHLNFLMLTKHLFRHIQHNIRYNSINERFSQWAKLRCEKSLLTVEQSCSHTAKLMFRYYQQISVEPNSFICARWDQFGLFKCLSHRISNTKFLNKFDSPSAIG